MIGQDLSKSAISAELLREGASNNTIAYSQIIELCEEYGLDKNELIGMAREIDMEVTGVPSTRPKLTLKGPVAAPPKPMKSKSKVPTLVIDQIKKARIFGIVDTGEKAEDSDFIVARLGAFKKERKAILDMIEGYEERAKADQIKIKDLKARLAQALRATPKRSSGDIRDKLPSEAQIKKRGADSFFRKPS